MIRRRLLSIIGAVGLLTGLISSGVVAQADTPMSDSAFQAMVNSYLAQANTGSPFCYAPGNTSICPVITQGSPASTSDNVAVCVQYDTAAMPTPQICSISQTNGTHNNIAIIIQIVNHRGSDVLQDATQRGTITHDNLSGNNFAAVLQIVRQTDGAAGDQIGNQYVAIDQNSPGIYPLPPVATGRNLAILGESTSQYGQSQGLTSTQTQFSRQEVSDATHHINQYSQGVSKAYPVQSQIQVLFGDGFQQQTIDPRCCSEQLVNTANVFPINESAIQVARRNNFSKNLSASQNSELFGFCQSSGNCTITQFASNNGTTFGPTTKSCQPGDPCMSNIACYSGEGSACAPVVINPGRVALRTRSTARLRSIS
jgi:hypothetical protein